MTPIEMISEEQKQELLNASLTQCVQITLNKYTDKYTLKMFVSALSNTIKAEYSDVLLDMAKEKNDFYKIIKLYKDNKWDLPILKISEYEYNIIQHFIIDAKDFKVATCVNGFGREENDFMSVYFLDNVIIRDIHLIDFSISLKNTKKIKSLHHLNKIRTELYKYLGIVNKKQSNQVNKNDSPERKYIAMHFALAYQLDCLANNRRPVTGSRKKLEAIATKRPKYTGDPYTFYRNCNNLMSEKGRDFNSNTFLSEMAGEDWRSIVLELSDDREALNSYLEAKEL